MKTIFKLFAGTLLILSLCGLNNVNADYCWMDNNPQTCVSYAFDIWGGEYRVYEIFVPENIEFYEYKFMTWQCTYDEYGCRLAYLNWLLIKKWLDSIY